MKTNLLFLGLFFGASLVQAQSLAPETIQQVESFLESINDNVSEVTDVWVAYVDQPMNFTNTGSFEDFLELEFSSNISSVAFGKDVSLSFQNIGEVTSENIASHAHTLWNCGNESLVYAACRIEGRYKFYKLEFTNILEAGHALGIQNTENVSFKLYPNPARDYLTIDFGQTVSGTIVVHDISGRVLFEEQNQSSKQRINVANWHTGMYILSVRNERGAVARETFLVGS